MNPFSSVVFGQTFCQALTFLKNVIIARALSPEDYGVAAILAMIINGIEMLSDLSIDKFIIQDKQEQTDSVVRCCQTLSLIRGSITTIILCLISVPLSIILNIPEYTWTILILALAPFIKSCFHLNIVQEQKKMNFKPMVFCEVMAHSCTVALTLVSSFYIRDYQLMLISLMGYPFFYTGFSILKSKSLPHFKFEIDIIKKVLYFAWPLLLNGVLMFLVFEGNKFILASSTTIFGDQNYSLSDVANFSIAFSLTVIPTLLISKVTTSLCLPLFSKQQNSSTSLNDIYRESFFVLTLICTLLISLFFFFGKELIHLIYGQQYDQSINVAKALILMQSLRILRVIPTIYAISASDTKNALFSNLFRCISLILSAVFCYYKLSIFMIAISGFIGEFFALCFSFWLLNKKHQLSPRLILKPAAIFILTLMGLGFTFYTIPQNNLIYLMTLLVIGLFTFKKLSSFSQHFSHQPQGT